MPPNQVKTTFRLWVVGKSWPPKPPVIITIITMILIILTNMILITLRLIIIFIIMIVIDMIITICKREVHEFSKGGLEVH